MTQTLNQIFLLSLIVFLGRIIDQQLACVETNFLLRAVVIPVILFWLLAKVIGTAEFLLDGSKEVSKLMDSTIGKKIFLLSVNIHALGFYWTAGLILALTLTEYK